MSSAYAWPLSGPAYSFSVGLGLSDKRSFTGETYGRGWMSQVYGRYALSQAWSDAYQHKPPRVEGLFQAAGKVFSIPAASSFYGAWDAFGMNINGASSVYSSASFSPYALFGVAGSLNADGSAWLAGNETGFQLFSFEVQNHLSFLYINRLFGTLSWRAALFDAQAWNKSASVGLEHQLVLKLGLKALGFWNGNLSLYWNLPGFSFSASGVNIQKQFRRQASGLSFNWTMNL
jgi:hypothetical protein